MPWEWKDETQFAFAQPPVYHKRYANVGDLTVMLWWAIFFSVMSTVAFALLVGSPRLSVYVSGYDQFGDTYSTSYSGPFTTGIVLMGIASISSFIIGIVMLARSWSPVLAQLRGMIIVMGIVALFGNLVFVAIVLGIILLVRLNAYKKVPLGTGVAPKPPLIV